MIYVKDNNQDKLIEDTDVSLQITGDPHVVTAELTLVLYEIYKRSPETIAAAIKTFWDEVKK